jgi:Ca2+-binding RTX toxin-like protein
MATAFRIVMDNVQVSPDTTSTATGLGIAIFDSVTVTVTYHITVTGLDFGSLLGLADLTVDPNDDVTQIHLQSQVREVSGPIVLPFSADDDGTLRLNSDGSVTFSGIWETSDSLGQLNGFIEALSAAAPGADVPLYWKISTPQFPAGAIRGQWVCIATDNGETVTGLVGVHHEILPGLGGNDTIFGFGGNDIINGGLGDDRMDGGAGDDIYIVDSIRLSRPPMRETTRSKARLPSDFPSMSKI